ncbi:MAG TPA: tryptophan synthase subunit alpha [Desulfomicrobiaceae bacterium]|nr:tryptophan synthase subunit alpha [Desulfomicrobiaceae bacterium]
MCNPLSALFENKAQVRIMTHVVAGFPDLDTTRQLVKTMASCGVSCIEIQIPFSDPLADGPTIMKASQHALDRGVTPKDCFALARELSAEVDIPLLFMTYANIPYAMGVEKFVRRSAEAGIRGLIIPDMAFDEENYAPTARKHGLCPIQVLSPTMRQDRLRKILSHGHGFVYTTLKTGITGAGSSIAHEGIEFIHRVKELSNLPVAAGFGISAPEHVRQVMEVADMAVIGSHVINLFSKHGMEAVSEFLKECTKK